MNESIFISQAIQALRPNSEYTFHNDDYSTIEWIKLEGDAPSLSEVMAEVENQKVLFDTKIERKAQAKASVQAKLQALGLDADDLKALGL